MASLALQYMSLSTSKQACRSSEQAAALRSRGEDARCAKKTSAAEPSAAASRSGCRGPGLPAHRQAEALRQTWHLLDQCTHTLASSPQDARQQCLNQGAIA